MDAFLVSVTSISVAEIGDRTAGMMIANVPVVFLGKAFANRLPLEAIHYGAAVVFAILGCLFLIRAFRVS